MLTEVGVIGETTPATVASCPEPKCLAVSRTTGFQVKVGKVHNPLSAPRAGTVVAWSITLGKPTSAQVKYFVEHEGGVAEAGIAVLRPQKRPNLTYKLVASSPVVKLAPYFGETAQFPLETSIPVKKGDVVALTVPTWAPALALGFGNDTSWRASRQKSQCLPSRHPTYMLCLFRGKIADYRQHERLTLISFERQEKGDRKLAQAQDEAPLARSHLSEVLVHPRRQFLVRFGRDGTDQVGTGHPGRRSSRSRRLGHRVRTVPPAGRECGRIGAVPPGSTSGGSEFTRP